MSYAIVSRGRILATTDLGFRYWERGLRCGWLVPTALGERLLPQATGVAPALRAEWILGSDASAHADVLSAIDQEHALALELRSETGEVIATESIAVIDTEYLLSLPSDSESTVSDEPEPYEADDWPRYQVQVTLREHQAIAST